MVVFPQELNQIAIRSALSPWATNQSGMQKQLFTHKCNAVQPVWGLLTVTPIIYVLYQRNALHCGVSLSKQWRVSLITGLEYGMERSLYTVTSISYSQRCSIQGELCTYYDFRAIIWAWLHGQLHGQHTLLYCLFWAYPVCVLWFRLLFQQCSMVYHIRIYISFSPLLFARSQVHRPLR